MCINKEVSLVTFLFSWGIGFYLIKRNINLDRWYGIFLLTFSSMQFVDFLLWILYEKNMFNSNYNLIITNYIIPLILMLELLSSYIGKIVFKNKNKFTNLSTKVYEDITNSIFPKILILYIIIVGIISLFNNQKTKIGKEGHLDWGSIPAKNNKYIIFVFFIYITLLSYPFLEYFNKYNSVKLGICIFVITLLSAFIYTESVGSYWCWIANILGILFLFAPYIDKKN